MDVDYCIYTPNSQNTLKLERYYSLIPFQIMQEINYDIEFINFLDKLIEQCENNLTELRIVSMLHKETVKQIEATFVGQSLSDFNEMATRQELHSLITISLLDLCVILRLIKTSQISWERIFLLRKGYLTIYETIKAYDKKKSKIRNLIYESGFPEQEFLGINLSIKEFKKKFDFDNGIANIRNKTAGHINENFDTFYDTVYGIEPSVGIDAIKSLMAILSLLDKFLQNFRDYLNKRVEAKSKNLLNEIAEKKMEILKKNKIKGQTK